MGSSQLEIDPISQEKQTNTPKSRISYIEKIDKIFTLKMHKMIRSTTSNSSNSTCNINILDSRVQDEAVETVPSKTSSFAAEMATSGPEAGNSYHYYPNQADPYVIAILAQL